jgi:hypothetical protein
LEALSSTTSYCTFNPVLTAGSILPDNDLRPFEISNMETFGNLFGILTYLLRQLSGLDLLYRCLGFSIGSGVCRISRVGDLVPLLIETVLCYD